MSSTTALLAKPTPATDRRAQQPAKAGLPVAVSPRASHGPGALENTRTGRPVDGLLEPLNRLAAQSRQLVRRPGLPFARHGESHEIPRYQFTGPRGGDDAIHLGVFATVHGDEPESGLGLVRFLTGLVAEPQLAQGFVIHAYPVCNPTGYADATRHARGGKDLNREFWRDTPEPEVRHLERELQRHRFHGIVSLHCDDTSHGLYGFLSGWQPSAVLSAGLLEPALRAGEKFLPRNCNDRIDGFHAHAGILSTCYEGVLRAPAGQARPPFEITFETPQLAPAHLQTEAFNAALRVILAQYRQLQAHAPNL